MWFVSVNGMFGGFPYAWPPVPPAHANGQPGAQPQQGGERDGEYVRACV